MMAASLAQGETLIAGAAREPEIVDLARLPDRDGGEDRGCGHQQHPASRACRRCTAPATAIIPDRIEAGTYAMAAGDHRRQHRAQERPARLLRRRQGGDRGRGHGAGRRSRAGSLARVANGGLKGSDAMTRPFPGFATDLQAQFMALMCVADGAAMITETIFENRFMHVPELARMGARINVHGASALVRGVKELKGAPVMATDLRASVSLVLAALAAKGETEINRIYHLDRGYERLEEKLGARRRPDRAGAVSGQAADDQARCGRRRGSGGDRRLPAGRPHPAAGDGVLAGRAPLRGRLHPLPPRAAGRLVVLRGPDRMPGGAGLRRDRGGQVSRPRHGRARTAS